MCDMPNTIKSYAAPESLAVGFSHGLQGFRSFPLINAFNRRVVITKDGTAYELESNQTGTPAAEVSARRTRNAST